MKKMLLGIMLFFSGFLGLMRILTLSILKPGEYKETIGTDHITRYGFGGFLKTYNLTVVFCVLCVTLIIGLLICLIEVFKKDKKISWLV